MTIFVVLLVLAVLAGFVLILRMPKGHKNVKE